MMAPGVRAIDAKLSVGFMFSQVVLLGWPDCFLLRRLVQGLPVTGVTGRTGLLPPIAVDAPLTGQELLDTADEFVRRLMGIGQDEPEYGDSR